MAEVLTNRSDPEEEDLYYGSEPEEEYIDYLSEEDAEDADLEQDKIIRSTVTDEQDERYYDTWTDTYSDYPTTISLEEVGDVHDPRFIYTGANYGDRYRDEVQDATPPFEGEVPVQVLTGRGRRARTVQQTVDEENVTDMADSTVSNDTLVVLETPRPMYSSKDVGYRKRVTPNTNRRGNRAKDAPYQSKLLSSVPIAPIEEVETRPQISSTTTVPLTRLDPEKLVSRDPRKWYKLPYLKTELNATGLVNIPPETSDRKYITHLALSLIEQYNVQYINPLQP